MPDPTPLQSTGTMEQPKPPPVAPAGAIQHQGATGAVIHDRPVAIPHPVIADGEIDTTPPPVIAPPATPPV